MSRRESNGERQGQDQAWTQDETLAVEQSLDLQIITHVKELLCTLWKQSRITTRVRTDGEAALSAAQQAVEHPDLKNLNVSDGAALSPRQWWTTQGEHDREF